MQLIEPMSLVDVSSKCSPAKIRTLAKGLEYYLGQS